MRGIGLLKFLALPLHDGGDFLDRENHAGLVIGPHDRNDRGIIPDRVLEFLQIQRAIRRHRQARDAEAHHFEPFRLIHDRGMLDLRRDDVLLARGLQRGPDRRVVALRTATGEDDLLRRRAEQGGHFLPRLDHIAFDLLAEAVSARRIAVKFGQKRHHRFENFRRNARGGIIIEVNDFGT
jgi:hypothetical protein